MNTEAWESIRRVFGSGQIMLLEYTEISNKRWEPTIIGIAPLDAPVDSERWRLTYLYYSPLHFQPVKVRDIEGQRKWTDRALYV